MDQSRCREEGNRPPGMQHGLGSNPTCDLSGFNVQPFSCVECANHRPGKYLESPLSPRQGSPLI